MKNISNYIHVSIHVKISCLDMLKLSKITDVKTIYLYISKFKV